MSGLQIRYPKGRVLAAGLLFHHSELPPSQLQQRVIEHWAFGSILYELPFGALLIWSNPRVIDMTQSPAGVVIRQSNVLSNILLSSSELQARKGEPEFVHLLHAGEQFESPLLQCPVVDMSGWFDLTQWVNVELTPFGKPEVEIKLAHNAVDANIRTMMKDKGLEGTAELDKQLDALKSLRPDPFREEGNRMAASMVGLWQGLKAIFGGDQPGQASNSQAQYGDQEPNPSPLQKVKDAVANQIMMSKLGGVIGKAQAKHVQKMMDLMNQGKITEALKNAIPLGNLQDAMRASRPSMKWGMSRSNLSIRTHAQGSASSYVMHDDMLDQLKHLYENTFKKLDQAGKYDEAAFVIAELLRDINRAVAYLEKHQQFKLAAELAEGQNLPPARVIRQWVLAGDLERALLIAKISGCFEEAITALDSDHQALANKLRWELALHHWQAGNILTACELAWPLKHKRLETIQWMKAAASIGDSIGAVNRLRLAIYDEADSQAHLQQLSELVKQDGPNNQAIKLAVIDEVCKHKSHGANVAAANMMTRIYLQDVSIGRLPHHKPRWHTLLSLSNDLALRADLRNLIIRDHTAKVSLNSINSPKTLAFDATHGRHPLDAAVLSNGDILVAFGESGVELWTPQGKKRTSYFVPCHQIVLSDHGSQALFVAIRDATQSVHIFSLSNRAVTFWQDLHLECWASSYDGLSWTVGVRDSVKILDMSKSDQLEALWAINDLGGRVTSIQRDSDRLGFTLLSQDRFAVWIYQLPNLFLKERHPHIHSQFEDVTPITFNLHGQLLILDEQDPQRIGVYRTGPTSNWFRLDQQPISEQSFLYSDWLMVASQEEKSELSLDLISVHHGSLQKKCITLTFPDITMSHQRRIGDTLLIWTDTGKIVHLDLSDGNLLSQLTV